MKAVHIHKSRKFFSSPCKFYIVYTIINEKLNKASETVPETNLINTVDKIFQKIYNIKKPVALIFLNDGIFSESRREFTKMKKELSKIILGLKIIFLIFLIAVFILESGITVIGIVHNSKKWKGEITSLSPDTMHSLTVSYSDSSGDAHYRMRLSDMPQNQILADDIYFYECVGEPTITWQDNMVQVECRNFKGENVSYEIYVEDKFENSKMG